MKPYKTLKNDIIYIRCVKMKRKISNFWKRAGQAVSKPVAIILLSVTYYTVFIVYRIVAGLFRKEILVSKKKITSNWSQVNVINKKEEFERLY